MKKCWLALALAVTLLVPVSAKANPLDSFTNGLDDLVNPKQDFVVEDPIRDYNEEYEPVLREPETVRADEEEEINYWNQIVRVLSGMAITFNGNRYFLTFDGQTSGNYYRGIRDLLLIVVPIAVLFVFFWWGLRKAKSIIMAAFRSGRLNLGTSIKRARYRRKAKEWYG